MKTRILRFFSVVGVVGIIAVACSTKKDAFVNRSFHSVTTKYNILYNGNLALDAGLQELAMNPDNFWDVLPIERMQIIEPVFGQDSIPRNANFKRAEEKATKAIEKHSMDIGGAEKNPQMDESYLLLGKARYYDQRFIPALEAFNYISYKYPDSDRINEIKVWKEKTNIRLDNNITAIINLKKLLKEVDFKDQQVVADANAILAQAFYNEEQNDSAVVYLKKAKDLTKNKEEKARYTFILGQLLEKQGNKDEAIVVFQEVIEMNRKSPRQYVIQSHAKQAVLGGNETKDTIAFLEKFNKLLKDRENRPHLDVLNHQMALFYEKQDSQKQAIKYYNSSLHKKTQDAYLVASNYRNLGEIYFYDAKYSLAGKYYDSTLVNLDVKTREHRNIKRKRENLEDVIKYEAIATNNDSILNLVKMSETDRIAFFEKHIDVLKKEEERIKKEQEKGNWQTPGHEGFEQQTRKGGMNGLAGSDEMSKAGMSKMAMERAGKSNSISGAAPPGTMSSTSNFYFYNQTTVSLGKTEFRKKWGNRPLKDYWRLANYSGGMSSPLEQEIDEEGNPIERDKNYVEPRFTTDFYITQIPTEKVLIDSLQKERNFAYYQLGIIYKDKFKEYELAQSKLENLLESNPEERLILPSMYNLYKIYEVLGSGKMSSMKSQITSKYPDSRYAQIINNPNSVIAMEGSSDLAYNSMYKIYQAGDYRKLLSEIDPFVEQYSGEEIVSKLELLKANAIGNLQGLEAYKKALNYVALTYPNSEEGKDAENILNTNIPKLEKLAFGKVEPASWKLIHLTNHGENLTELNTKLDKFLKDRPNEGLKISLDSYTENQDFVTIHNVYTERDAKDFIAILSEYKDYKIREKFIVISSEDYKVIQVKKNFEQYLQKINPNP